MPHTIPWYGKAMIRFSVVAFLFSLWATYDAPNTLDERPIAEGSVGWFKAEFGCWSDTAPLDMAGKVPGHVVFHTGGDWRMGGQAWVDKALKQTFEDEDHGMTIAAYCR